MQAFHILFAVTSAFAKDFPSFIKPCSRAAPDLNKCMKTNIESCKQHLALGIPELYIPPLDPFKITSAELKNNAFSLALHNLEIRGFAEFNVSHINVNLDENTFEVKFDFDGLSGSCNLNLEGTLIQLNLFSNGKVYGNSTNIGVLFKFKTQPFTRNGRVYLKLKDPRYEITRNGNLFVNFQNIYRDNKLLSAAINKLINENVDVFFKDITPISEYIFDITMGLVFKKIFTNIPYDELFPVDN